MKKIKQKIMDLLSYQKINNYFKALQKMSKILKFTHPYVPKYLTILNVKKKI